MIFVKLILFILTMFIIPLLVGMFFTSFFKNEKSNLILAFVLGYLYNFAISEIIAVPLIFLKTSFMTFVVIYIVISVVLSIISISRNKENIDNICSDTKSSIKEMPKILTIILVILIGVQSFALVKYAHIDDDDAFYVGTATTTVYTNSMFKYDGSTGLEYGKLPIRYVVGPFPIYIALISKLICISPAIVAHTILPAVLIPIVYLIYGLIAEELFSKNKKATIIFLIMLCFLYMWGNFSKRTNFTFLLFRIWQGKAVLGNIIIPCVWLLFIKALKNNFDIISCILLGMIIFAGVLTTSMGIGLPAITLLSLAVIFAFKDKEISYVVKSGICCIPCIVYFILYVIIHYNLIG